jgi:hypothetical protein
MNRPAVIGRGRLHHDRHLGHVQPRLDALLLALVLRPPALAFQNRCDCGVYPG